MAELVCVMSYECRSQVTSHRNVFSVCCDAYQTGDTSKCESSENMKIYVFFEKKKNWNGRIRFACHRIASNLWAELCFRFPLLNRTHTCIKGASHVSNSLRGFVFPSDSCRWVDSWVTSDSGTKGWRARRAHLFSARVYSLVTNTQNWLSTVNARIRATCQIHHKRKGTWDSSAKLNLFLSISASLTQRLTTINHVAIDFELGFVFRASGRRVRLAIRDVFIAVWRALKDALALGSLIDMYGHSFHFVIRIDWLIREQPRKNG